MGREERILKRKRRIEEMENYGLDAGFYQSELRKKHGLDARRPDEGVRHSKSYHRFFEGYSEQRVLAEDGKHTRILRVYVGDYYKRACDDRSWIFVKMGYLLLFLIAAAAFVYALTVSAGSNHAWYVALPGLCSVVPFMLLFAKLMACMVTRRKMMIYDYKQVFKRLPGRCFVTAGFLLATALTKVVYLCLHLGENLAVELLSCAMCLLAAGAVLGIAFMERNAGYETIKNGNLPSEDGVIIE